MVYAHAAYGFGALYLEHGLFTLGKTGVGHLRTRGELRQRIPDDLIVEGDNTTNDRTIFLLEFLNKSKVVFKLESRNFTNNF